MGLFRRRPKVEHELLAWMDTTAKLRGLAEEVAKRRADDTAVLVLAHFADTASTMSQVLTAAGIAPEPWSLVVGWLLSPAGGYRGLVATALSAEIPPMQPLPSGCGMVSVVVAEAYPTPARDEVIDSLAAALTDGGRVTQHVSLDEPVLKRFGGEKLPQLLAALGAESEQPLQSSMIARALANAQRTLARSASSDMPAASAEAWLQINLPAR